MPYNGHEALCSCVGIWKGDVVMRKKVDILYSTLFNAITDAIYLLERDATLSPQTTKALGILKEAQCKTEELYINFD